MRVRGLSGAVMVLALLVPASAAAAAEKPVAITGAPANVGQSSVVLNGAVNPKEAETTYFFQYGTTRLYGATTPAASAGAGAKRVKVAVGVGDLAPATTYHYRLIAQNSEGMTRGKNRTFRTQRQPLGVTLGASVNPVRSGRATVLAGQLTGTGNAGRQVTLQANPFPYTQGFLAAANTQITNEDGTFAFPILSVPVNTQYRVLMPQRQEVVSPVVVVGTTVRVGTKVKKRRGARRGRLRFTGRIRPAVDGAQVLIQKRRRGEWVTIEDTFARHSSSSASRYRKTVRQRRGGRYRVLANLEGAHVPTAGRTVRRHGMRR
ncbi:MAG: hypothetical protein ACRDPC_22000 [Solirubrobacteraceae bacterium]